MILISGYFRNLIYYRDQNLTDYIQETEFSNSANVCQKSEYETHFEVHRVLTLEFAVSPIIRRDRQISSNPRDVDRQKNFHCILGTAYRLWMTKIDLK